MNHKGITQYSGEWAANINLGQPGFLHIDDQTDKHHAGDGTTAGTDNYYSAVNQWAAIKNVTNPQAATELGNIRIEVGTYTGLTDTARFYMAPGDIVYGPFSYVKIMSGTDGAILAYIG